MATSLVGMVVVVLGFASGLPLVSGLTGALPVLGGDGLTGVLDTLTGTLGSTGLLGGGLLGALRRRRSPVFSPPASQPGAAVGGVGGLPDLAGVVATGRPRSTSHHNHHSCHGVRAGAGGDRRRPAVVRWPGHDAPVGRSGGRRDHVLPPPHRFTTREGASRFRSGTEQA